MIQVIVYAVRIILLLTSLFACQVFICIAVTILCGMHFIWNYCGTKSFEILQKIMLTLRLDEVIILGIQGTIH